MRSSWKRSRAAARRRSGMGNVRVRTGNHFQMGNWACAEGALAAGCDFAAGYPITPASEVANYLGPPPSRSGRGLSPDRGRNQRLLRGRGRGLGGTPGHDRDQRSRHQPHAGDHRFRRSHGNATGHRGRAAFRTVYRRALRGPDRRHDAGSPSALMATTRSSRWLRTRRRPCST